MATSSEDSEKLAEWKQQTFSRLLDAIEDSRVAAENLWARRAQLLAASEDPQLKRIGEIDAQLHQLASNSRVRSDVVTVLLSALANKVDILKPPKEKSDE